ncbi:YraN family protein [Neptuniibacter sp.]|uniref:YraN family protein n=1 Tax=Neptuniibacter sp. TaxID=1962643 RepID=UPI00263802FF|nr:YraN family protein [Neptuniibacter sp.]MCP4597929.1 YraN family protein [Neptuniibacter sp.]
MDRKSIGTDAENNAKSFLEKHHLILIHKNYYCRYGEIDLIMLDQHTLVFIEVRQRSSLSHGGAAASVTTRKQKRIIHTAQHFLTQNPRYQNKNCRFDVIAYEYDAAPDKPLWYKGAFNL